MGKEGDKIKDNSEGNGGGFEVPEEWVRETAKEDHRVISRALENPARREIMKFIGFKSEKNLEEISEEFDIHSSEAKMHLNYLTDAEIVEKIEGDPPTYKLDSIGKKYLKNVEKIEE